MLFSLPCREILEIFDAFFEQSLVVSGFLGNPLRFRISDRSCEYIESPSAGSGELFECLPGEAFCKSDLMLAHGARHPRIGFKKQPIRCCRLSSAICHRLSLLEKAVMSTDR